jgi:DNA-binding LacI/PurR family transcriptional regulator
VTIQDVADAAGVSLTTVSHALNGKGRVDETTRSQIRAEADALGYSPNRAARGLASGKTFTLGIALPERAGMATTNVISTDFFGRVIVSASRAALAHHYAVALLPPFTSVSELHRHSVDGVVVLEATVDDPRLQVLARSGIPHVTTDRDPAHPEVPYVRVDAEGSADALIDHLAARGARRILFLAPDVPLGYFAEALARAKSRARDGLEVEVRVLGDPTISDRDAVYVAARKAAQEALGTAPRPDAIVGMYEGFGGNIIAAAHALGLSVPDDVRVAEDVDSISTQTAPLGITAVDHQVDEIATACVELLLARINGDEERTSRTVPVELRTRAST